MCPTRHFVYIFFNPVFQLSTAKNKINLFNNRVLIVVPVTGTLAGARTPSAEFLFTFEFRNNWVLCQIIWVSIPKFLKIIEFICSKHMDTPLISCPGLRDAFF